MDLINTKRPTKKSVERESRRLCVTIASKELGNSEHKGGGTEIELVMAQIYAIKQDTSGIYVFVFQLYFLRLLNLFYN